jgi:hypothetical protein
VAELIASYLKYQLITLKSKFVQKNAHFSPFNPVNISGVRGVGQV